MVCEFIAANRGRFGVGQTDGSCGRTQPSLNDSPAVRRRAPTPLLFGGEVRYYLFEDMQVGAELRREHPLHHETVDDGDDDRGDSLSIHMPVGL